MPDALQSLTAFDDAERRRIRQKCLHYMRVHGIGVPTLASRISAAFPRGQTVPVKTLQNFLSNARRTNDAHVALFSRFSDTVPDPPDDPLDSLGVSLAAAFTARGEVDLSGLYVSSERGHMSEFDIRRDGAHWRVTEAHMGPVPAVYDGVLADALGSIVVLLKERATGTVRTITLHPRADDELHGYALTAHFSSGETSSFWHNDQRSFGAQEIKLMKGETMLALLERTRSLEDYRKQIDQLLQSDDPSSRFELLSAAMLEAANSGIDDLVDMLLDSGVSIEHADSVTGLTALHLAVCRDRLPLAEKLVMRGAPFKPDRLGRTPSALAIECQVSEAMCDFIVAAEAGAGGV